MILKIRQDYQISQNRKFTMDAIHLNLNHWALGRAFASHYDMKSHSGSLMTLGHGMMERSSNK